MNAFACPHCKTKGLVIPKFAKNAVAILACPACNELVVQYRKKVIALKRRILERGTFEERKMHLAEIIAEFLEAGLFPLQPTEFTGAFEAAFEPDDDDGEEELAEKPKSRRKPPISQSEVERFIKIDLQKIDESGYFRKHFG
ncbi:MAG: hypothetical protein HY706_21940 [Candidatus Hydrogenedentes bacterium]|nr:hypothetical protein [Candidatus Hydrogenedentota bacterium]